MDEETLDKDYIKGFNQGHLMAQHMPDLAEKLAPAMEKSSRGMGFKDGRDQALLELRREKYPAWRRTDWLDKPAQSDAPEKQKDLDKDMDAPEPEID